MISLVEIIFLSILFLVQLSNQLSHLVAEQHDDHVLLSILVDLCQPGLERNRRCVGGGRKGVMINRSEEQIRRGDRRDG